MPLSSGSKLGPYEIVAAIGAGGMGEVYRARDTRLDRTVAIKVLHSQLIVSTELKARFEREAKVISQLQHPNICVLHDIGSENGTDFLVMEFLEGESLSEKLKRGPLPTAELLKTAIDVADALEKAHRAGIIHRDLKPGNVMLTKSGAKLLDFGLAKTMTATVTSAGNSSASVFAAAVTLSSPASPLSSAGAILGTVQYMAPEQIQGLEADARSDIFAFGLLLYEMATGKRAFQGKTQSSVVGQILAVDPPPISSLQPMTPAALSRLVSTCLEKDPEERFQTIHDVKLQLQWIAEAGSQVSVPAQVASPRKTRERTVWSIVVAAVVLIAIALAIGYVQRAPKPAQPMRLNAELGADVALYTDYGANAVLSPDGTRLVFVAIGADKARHLYTRSLDQTQASVLSGTEGVRDPFFSPDDQWIAFFAGGKLKKVSAQGGAVVTLCDAPNERGGSWGDDDSIVFAAGNREGLSRVSSAGGNPAPLTTLNQQAGEVTHRWPQVLPGSKDVIFTDHTSGGQFDDAEIAVYSAASGKVKTVLHGGLYARYLPSGHLVYVHNSTLFAVPFDIKRLEVTGQPSPVVEGVSSNPSHGGAQLSFSDSGTFVYFAGASASQIVSISWMDAAGKFTTLRETPGDYSHPAISPDGKRLAMDITSGNRTDIWVYEWERDTLTRLTFNGDSNTNPLWTPDGRRIVYQSSEKGKAGNPWWIRADGGGDAQRLAESKYTQVPWSLSPDGKILAFHQSNPGTGWDIFTMSVEGNEKTGWKPAEPKPFVNSPATEVAPAFSPDGRWIAYFSNESGSIEVYVRPFPGPGGKWQVSTGGGYFPAWSRNGKELFYRASDSKIMVVNYTSSGDSFHADKPRQWSPGQFTDRGVGLNFALHPDGKRFAVLKAPNATESSSTKNVSFIFNFFDELRRKVPNGKN
jgi:Tol biopolymer transport system component/tRNA A-37 threonylcarbamoyl transferase component Bud32